MTAASKKLLATTIQSLRARLLLELHDATESAYQLAIPRARDASLSEANGVRRARLETWIDEQVRGAVEAELTGRKKPSWTAEKVTEERARIDATLPPTLRPRLRLDVEKTAAYTLLNRLVLLRLMEAGRRATAQVVTGGWQSGGYRAFREMNPALVVGDPSEGYAFLLQMLFEELAGELPGLFGGSNVSELVPIPVPTLRHVIEALDHDDLETCWTDDMTLGWVYQYWNDPEREALDAKLNAGGKVERHEIASKTQMFTERYMVDWLLQNSLGPIWFAMCQRHGWTAEAVADGTLDRLETRRIAWRHKRDIGDVSLTALMPVAAGMEQRWAYFVPQPIPADAVDKAPASVQDLRIIDPAVGSGHFLVVAFDLLFALYNEEARHRGEVGDARWTDKAITERILEHNLSGIDLDPRAVQIAAAALWLKARQTCPEARPRKLNLVAAALKLGSLPDDDPALVELRREVERDTGIPGELTDTLIHALRGADHLGSLLKVDAAVDDAIARHETALSKAGGPVQASLFGPAPAEKRIAIDAREAKATVLDRIEGFLARHTRGDDLGLRLRGEQLAVGVRFVRLVKEGSYDLVVGNPPYQGTAKLDDAAYVQATYPRGKADLYAAFLERGLQLTKAGGTSALLTMRNWMFIKQYVGLRTWLLESFDLRSLGDFAVGAFDSVPNDVLSVVVSVIRKTAPVVEASVASQPTPLDDRSYDRERTERKRAAVLAGVGRVAFRVEALRVVPEWPVVYWWDADFVVAYSSSPLVGTVSPAREGITTADNTRFRRWTWELPAPCPNSWVPLVGGANGIRWVAPVLEHVEWGRAGLAIKVKDGASIRNDSFQSRIGVAFTTIGADFGGRVFRRESIFEAKGRSIFPNSTSHVVCLLNTGRARRIVESLNPGVDFTVGDVNRLPLFPIADADEIFATIEAAFTVHESHREPSVEFKSPGHSPWDNAQAWAQLAVDRPEGAPLPAYVEELGGVPESDHLSYALGVALGRFGPNGEGILDPSTASLAHALPSALLFLDGTLDDGDRRDSLGNPAAAPLLAAWRDHFIAPSSTLRDYLRTDFFAAVHRQMYDNRPIHWPLSSKKKTFVAWVTIHRWTAGTLRDLLADHLYPTRARLSGEVDDLRATRDAADKTAARNAEKRLARIKPALDELTEFIAAVEQCAESGPPPTDPACKPREVNARYVPDLDDGVMINSAALWPLLAPQWKDPAKWWKELSTPSASKHYDWAHLAMRYWPTRVDARCKEDPSLGVAHGCFWAYHPKRAWAWELRLQDEIGPEFRIVEASYRGDGGDARHREAYLRESAAEALATVEAEVLRRRRKKKAAQESLGLMEAGLWTREPRACWGMECVIEGKQGEEFLLRAPDEAEARAALIAGEPALVEARRRGLEGARGQVGLGFGGGAAASEDDGGEGAEA